MPEVDLLAKYPKAKRNVKARMTHKEENRCIALLFGVLGASRINSLLWRSG